MRYMIASDIHGSGYYANLMMERFLASGAEKLILLGDILYHGPRNDLPRDYDPKFVSKLLNGHAGKILAVRGNCEAEVDQMMLSFPVLGEYAYLVLAGAVIYASHGHHASESAPPPLGKNEILLCGHTHVPKCAEHDGFIYMNPGSVSIPKENSPNSYMMLEDGVFSWMNIETGEKYMEYRV